MHRQWPPWWAWALAALLALPATLTYVAHLTIGPMGWTVEREIDSTGRPLIRVASVRPGTPAAEADFRIGDRFSVSDLESFLASAERGRSFAFRVERDGTHLLVSLQVPAGGIRYWTSLYGIKGLLAMGASALCLLLAGVIVLMRSRDPIARWSALFLAQLGVIASLVFFFTPLPPEFASLIRRLPRVVGVLALTGFSISTLYPATALTFAGTFPRQPPGRRRLAVLWLPALLTIPMDLRMFWLPVYNQEGRTFVSPSLSVPALVVGFAYLAAAVTLLLRNYLTLTAANDRRRVTVLVFGLAVTIVGAAGMVVVALPWPAIVAFRTTYWTFLSFFFPLTVACAPVCTAYAILRHRMFDIPFMVRLGLQYAAARGILASLVPLTGVALVIDLLAHGDQPLVATVRQRGWLYAFLMVAAYLLHARQASWLAALDRRFFRERYNAQRVLHGVVEEVRRSTRFDEVAPRVITEIDSALHPEFAALMLRRPGSEAHRVLASRGTPPPPLASGSTLVALLRVLGKPMEIEPDETGWVLRQLPPDESGAIRQARIEWIFPIALAPQPTEALLVVGRKRSEEPYSREDQELLQAIAASLALLLERSPAAAAAEAFEECPECGACYDSGTGRCARDGAHLGSLPFRRTIFGRYQLERRLGRGGMGTVYQGVDTELSRRVAVKLLRPELMTGEQAMARFRHEAKAAASFSHPNVVTVHDFGIADDGRAYLVMELLEGLTLRDALARDGPLAPRRALRLLHGICAAVGVAHGRGLLHRDLKPENVFLTTAGGQEIAKVLDFGIAKQLHAAPETRSVEADTLPGVLVGTPRYMSPEQLRGEAPDASWDLWALAVVAFEMLTGKHPSCRSTEAASNGFPDADLTAAQPQWRPFFDSALDRDRSRRPGSAALFFDLLQASLQAEGEVT